MRNIQLEKDKSLNGTNEIGNETEGRLNKTKFFTEEHESHTPVHFLLRCTVHHYRCISSYPKDTVMKKSTLRSKADCCHTNYSPQILQHFGVVLQATLDTPPQHTKKKKILQ